MFRLVMRAVGLLRKVVRKMGRAFMLLDNPDFYYCDIKRLRKKGMKIGENVKILHSTIIDDSRAFLIEIGNNVTIAPNCHILTHDAAPNTFMNMTRIGKVRIRNNCFIGANTVVLPNVTIGPNAIVGAGSVVTRDVPPSSVFAGNPARRISSLDAFLEKHRSWASEKQQYPYGRYHGNFISKEDSNTMSQELDEDWGYSVR